MGLLIYPIFLFSLPFSMMSPGMIEIFLNGTLSLNSAQHFDIFIILSCSGSQKYTHFAGACANPSLVTQA